MSGRFDEAREAHRGESRPGARPRADLAGGRPGAAQRLRRAAGRQTRSPPSATCARPRRCFREIGEGWFLSTVAVDLPRAVYEQGRYDDAFALLASDRRNAGAARPRVADQAHGRSRRACSPRRGRLEEAEALAREGVALAADSEFVGLHADVLLDLAEVLRLAGRSEEAREATAVEAVRLYERKGNVAGMARAENLVGSF